MEDLLRLLHLLLDLCIEVRHLSPRLLVLTILRRLTLVIRRKLQIVSQSLNPVVQGHALLRHFVLIVVGDLWWREGRRRILLVVVRRHKILLLNRLILGLIVAVWRKRPKLIDDRIDLMWGIRRLHGHRPVHILDLVRHAGPT